MKSVDVEPVIEAAAEPLRYTCLVCGYGLDRSLTIGRICSCCGTEYGFDDYATSYEELRRAWKDRGYEWFSPAVAPPPGWNPRQQLFNAGFDYSVTLGHEDDPPKKLLRAMTSELISNSEPRTMTFAA